jgi:hypothetical protein
MFEIVTVFDETKSNPGRPAFHGFSRYKREDSSGDCLSLPAQAVLRKQFVQPSLPKKKVVILPYFHYF